MNFDGILIGGAAFIIIGIFHPIVIKSEYYFGVRIWPIFLVVGLLCLALSTLINSVLVASIVGIFGFSSLWSIHELIEQAERVRKGWFPANPQRSKSPEAPTYGD